MNQLVTEFCEYIRDIFANAPAETRDQKLETVLARFEDASVRKSASTMLAIDVDASAWTDEELGERMLRHVSHRSSKTSMMPAHCMMLEAARRLKGATTKERSP